ncbi:MAG: hypothetical protein HZB39_19485 [Planctomycetes bacterium]|nr:hypothetical protein [Planctomycetota bacterium]
MLSLSSTSFRLLARSCTIASASALAAQAPIDGDDGPFMNPPGLISLSAATAPPNGQVLRKLAGFSTTFPQPAVGLVDFSESALLGGASGLDIDAFSVGLDWVFTDSTGRIPAPGTGSWSWAAILISPAATTNAGLSVHPRIATELARPNGIGGDLFSMIIRGSVLPGYPTFTTDRVDLIAESSEISIYQGTSPRMDAYDLMATLYETAVPGLPWPPRAYFSVTADTAAAIPANWGTQSGATIFATQWTGTSWTTPFELRSPASLGLTVANDVDGIAVDLFHNPTTYIVFSLAPNVGPSSSPSTAGTGLSFTRTGMTGRAVLRFSNNVPIDDGFGRGVNPIAVCMVDPGRDPLLRSMMGQPLAPPFLPWITGSARAVEWLDRDPRRPFDSLEAFMLSDPCTVFGTSNTALFTIHFPAFPAVLGPAILAPAWRGGGFGSHYWRGCPATVSIDLPFGISGSGLVADCYWLDVDPFGAWVTALPSRFTF